MLGTMKTIMKRSTTYIFIEVRATPTALLSYYEGFLELV
jgi:hypothetical protein